MSDCLDGSAVHRYLHWTPAAPEPYLTQKPETESVRCWIRLGGHELELQPGQAVVGRHDSCDVVLDDLLASRRHAVFHFSGSELSVEDLDSVNGVLVNEKRIDRTHILKHGDAIRVGSQRIVVHLGTNGAAVPGRKRTGAPTLAGVVMPSADADGELTAIREGEALETLTLVAEKVLALGRGAEAERILQKALLSLCNHAKSGGGTDESTLQTAAVFAVRLAEATNKGEWIDFVFDLYMAAGRVLPGAVVDRLYTAVRSVGAVRIDLLRSYLAQLQLQQMELGPAERFLIRRIEGLERLVVLR